MLIIVSSGVRLNYITFVLFVQVERTKDRPLVSGAVTQFDALVFLSGQLGLGLLVLLQLNWYCILLGASSLGKYCHFILLMFLYLVNSVCTCLLYTSRCV